MIKRYKSTKKQTCLTVKVIQMKRNIVFEPGNMALKQKRTALKLPILYHYIFQSIKLQGIDEHVRHIHGRWQWHEPPNWLPI